jgi:hypothetical protein
MTGWTIGCSTCLSTDVEKVSGSYYYCRNCQNLWEVVAAAGRQKALPPRTGTEWEKRFTKREQRPILNAPDPGNLEPSGEIDFP